MRPRALTAVSAFLGLALGAYACDNGTFNDEVPVYNPGDAGGYFPEDSGSETSAPSDAATGDAASKDGGSEAGSSSDAGEGGSPTDAPTDSGELDAADASG
jgi:hypothetical protein